MSIWLGIITSSNKCYELLVYLEEMVYPTSSCFVNQAVANDGFRINFIRVIIQQNNGKINFINSLVTIPHPKFKIGHMYTLSHRDMSQT